LTSKTEQFYIQHIAELEKQPKQRDERIATLEKQVAELTDKIAKLSKNSSNSSKPPSSDIVKPPRKTKNKKPRKTGGQPGHTKHERTPATKTKEINTSFSNTIAVPDSNSFIDGVTDTVSKANFGFIVKYKKCADNPDGNLEFQYKAGESVKLYSEHRIKSPIASF
jgi:hypothetical protein